MIYYTRILYIIYHTLYKKGPSWFGSYGSWIYNLLWNNCLSPLLLWVRIPNRARCTTLWVVFNTTFNNISVISWRSVLLVKETGKPGENHPPAASQWQPYPIMLFRKHLVWVWFEKKYNLEAGNQSTHTG
jgi:hypothetical protein